MSTFKLFFFELFCPHHFECIGASSRAWLIQFSSITSAIVKKSLFSLGVFFFTLHLLPYIEAQARSRLLAAAASSNSHSLPLPLRVRFGLLSFSFFLLTLTLQSGKGQLLHFFHSPLQHISIEVSDRARAHRKTLQTASTVACLGARGGKITVSKSILIWCFNLDIFKTN